jgi:hypothetical protein
MSSESALALGLLSGMAESARNAVSENGSHRSSGQTKEKYAAIGAGVLEALRPGIRTYERGLKNPDEEVQEFCEILIEAIGG